MTDSESGAESEWLLRDIDLSISDGQQIAITGPSGAGKTLLLRQLAALDAADEGVLLWNGQQLRDAQVPEYRSHVMYLHQRPYFVEGSVAENLEIPFRFGIHAARHFSLESAKQRLTQIGRDHRLLTQDTESLSGGESQLVALLRAIQLEPDVLLLDEPTASADSEMAAAIERLIAAWQSEHATASFVIVSHTETQVARMAQRELRMNAGTIIEDRVAR